MKTAPDSHLVLSGRLGVRHGAARPISHLLRAVCSLRLLQTIEAVAPTGGATVTLLLVPSLINDQAATLTLYDLASAGNEWRQGNYYRTWLAQPLDLGRVYDTGETWKLLTHRPYRQMPPAGR